MYRPVRCISTGGASLFHCDQYITFPFPMRYLHISSDTPTYAVATLIRAAGRRQKKCSRNSISIANRFTSNQLRLLSVM
jgi:hypothetical protein